MVKENLITKTNVVKAEEIGQLEESEQEMLI